MINRYTVIGQPIAHSLSPVVHQMFGQLTQRKISYTRTESTPETFNATLENLQTEGYKGCNVTSPFKRQAVEACDSLSQEARMAGSVNTVHMRRDGQRVGHTTDGRGLVADILTNKRVEFRDKRLLLIGAGGASRGVMQALLEQSPAMLHIVNRTVSKAEALAELFSDFGELSASHYGDLESIPDFEQGFDIAINATTLGMSGEMPALPQKLLNENALAYDMTYVMQDTPFMAWAKTCGAQTANGLGMLVEQAAESFLIWEDARPKTRMVYPRLREILAGKA